MPSQSSPYTNNIFYLYLGQIACQFIYRNSRTESEPFKKGHLLPRLGGKELIVLNDENIVDKENMVDANANDAIDGDCFVHCPPLSKTKGRPK